MSVIRRQLCTCTDKGCNSAFTVSYVVEPHRVSVLGCPFCGNLDLRLERHEDCETVDEPRIIVPH